MSLQMYMNITSNWHMYVCICSLVVYELRQILLNKRPWLKSNANGGEVVGGGSQDPLGGSKAQAEVRVLLEGESAVITSDYCHTTFPRHSEYKTPQDTRRYQDARHRCCEFGRKTILLSVSGVFGRCPNYPD